MKCFKHAVFFFVALLCFSCNNETLGDAFFDNGAEVIPNNFLENFGDTIEADFFGRVFNEAKQPLAGVTVTLGNTTVITNSKGVFSFTSASVQEKFAYIKASKDGYVSSSRSVTPNKNGNIVEIMLFSLDDAITIESGIASEVSLTNGAKITFLDGNFVNAQNEAYSGSVSVYFNYLSPNSEAIALQMPGMLIGQRESGALRTLETFGMISVELRGTNNEVLQLAQGNSAQISIPSGSSAANAPATIPLWSFNEDTGYWIEEGEATLEGNNYVGEVTHFSFWNLDFPIETVYMCVNLTDINGNPLAYTPVNLYSPRLNLLGTYGFTDAQGQECGLIPKDDQMFLVLPNFKCNGENYSQLIGPFFNDTSIDIVISDESLTNTTLTAQFNSCENNPIENGYVEVAFSFKETPIIYPIFPSNEGQMALNVFYCDNATYNLRATNTQTNQQSMVINGNLTSPTTAIGVVELCQDAPLQLTAVNDTIENVQVSQTNGANEVLNLIANDSINGQLIEDASLVTLTPLQMPNAFMLNDEGFINVRENTPTGNYQFFYELCIAANNDNCDMATVSVAVVNTSTSTLIANNDFSNPDNPIRVSASQGAQNVLNVLDNDVLNNEPPNINNVTFSDISIPSGIVLNDNGSVDVPENTPSGQYSFQYTICEINNAGNCATALVTLEVINEDQNQINAEDDTLTNVDGSLPRNAIFNVFDNDTLTGTNVNEETVTLTSNFSETTDYFRLNTNGSIDIILEAVPQGTYVFTYTICLVDNPNLCDSANVTITVE